MVEPLPDGWHAGKFDTDDIHTGRNNAVQANFELTSQPSRAFGKMTFADWAKRKKEQEAKESGLKDRKETDLKPVKVGGRDAMEYEITGSLVDAPFHYRVYFVQVRGVYAMLTCWSDPAHWDVAQGKFDGVAANVK